MVDSQIKEAALASNAWPFVEAQKILEKINFKTPKKGFVLFETGYGPSGLPHIGTFGEVARTLMVKHAFGILAPEIPTKLWVVSDDIDGIRKVPDNVPNVEMVRENLGRPTTSVPDPFGTHESYGHHMNARLRAFLDKFNFEYEFFSATECYKTGKFDEGLIKVLENYDAVMDLMLPTLGEERQATYSPFLPICPKTGVVLQVPIVARNVEKRTVSYNDPKTGELVEVLVTGGHCKLQWKPDFGMRWAIFDVDFEMYGKDHLPNGPLYTQICEAIGGKAPHQFFYELFLDETGQKISKSKGNGLTIDEWLTYAPTESLSLFMYNAPRKAKRLYFDVIPKNMDDYITHLAKYESQDQLARFQNPVYHIHAGKPPKAEAKGLTFSLLLNLVAACNTSDKEILWGFISKYDSSATPKTSPMMDKLAGYAVQYYNDFIKPNKKYRTPSEQDIANLISLKEELQALSGKEDGEAIQTMIYEIGKKSGYELKDFFQAMYEILLGQSQGPRLGSFVELYGIENTCQLIDVALKNKAA